MVPRSVLALRRLRGAAGHLSSYLAGAAAFGIASLLVALVVGRAFGLNIVWIPEMTRIVFVWGVAMGTIAVSCAREHFQVELFGKEDENAPTLFSAFRTAFAIVLFAYVAIGGYPTIAGASMQAFASLPFSYSLMRIAVILCVAGMCLIEVLILIEKIMLITQRPADNLGIEQ